jgi:hypothetical protein
MRHDESHVTALLKDTSEFYQVRLTRIIESPVSRHVQTSGRHQLFCGAHRITMPYSDSTRVHNAEHCTQFVSRYSGTYARRLSELFHSCATMSSHLHFCQQYSSVNIIKLKVRLHRKATENSVRLLNKLEFYGQKKIRPRY